MILNRVLLSNVLYVRHTEAKYRLKDCEDVIFASRIGPHLEVSNNCVNSKTAEYILRYRLTSYTGLTRVGCHVKINMVTAESVKETIERSLRCQICEVVDVSGGCGSSFQVTVVSEDFEGVPLLRRHRSINDLFKEEMQTQIHAFTLKTYTPKQFAELNS